MLKRIEDTMNAAETSKLNREGVDQILDEILDGFKLRQPSDYFVTNPTDDTECILARRDPR